MNIDLDPPVQMNAALWALRFNRKDLSEYLKTSALFASFAAAIASSAIMAYTHVSRWQIVTATVTLINLYVLPKILHHGNATMIHYALTINLAALSSLFLGGIGAATFSMSRTLLTSLNTYQFSTALFCTFGITALLGYGLPLFKEAIEKAYQLLNKPDEWKENISNLQQQFHRMPEMGLGFLQTNLWQSLVLQMALIKPESILSYWQFLFISTPDYVWSMAAAASGKVSFDQFKEMLDTLDQAASLADIQDEDLPNDIQENYRNRLEIAMRGLKKEDLDKAVALLIESGAKFIPRVLSNEQFLKLFIDDALEATNSILQEFLDKAADWQSLAKKCQDLEANILQLEKEVLQFETDSKDVQKKPDVLKKQKLFKEHEELSARLQGINEEFSTVRGEVEKVYVNKRTWINFKALWNKGQNLPFEHGDDLLKLLHDQSFMDEIDKTYRSLIGTGQMQNQTLSDHMQLITNKLVSSNEKAIDEDELTSVMFLAANKGFIQQDFEDLQEWLNLDTPNELEEALASIGLATEDDLYLHDILEPQDISISKTEIRDHLRFYIEKTPVQKKLAGRLDPLDEIDHKQRVYKLGETVSKLFYYAITSGVILVPILIHPYAGLSGFVAGSVVFILTRFGVQRTTDLVNLSNEVINSIPLGNFMRGLVGRRIFSLTPRRREGANQFVSADFFGRMRLINTHMLAAIFISYMMSFRQPFVGSFLQGVALAHEVVHLV